MKKKDADSTYEYEKKPEINVTNDKSPVTDAGARTAKGKLNTEEDGKIPILTVQVEYINRIIRRNLAVSKFDTDGEDHDLVDFSFTVTLTLPDEWKDFDLAERCEIVSTPPANPIEIDWLQDEDDPCIWYGEFSLTHGSSVEIQGLPMGTRFTVKESDPKGHNLQKIVPSDEKLVEENLFTTDWADKSASGTIPTGEIEDIETVGMTFWNSPAPELPLTGEYGNGMIYVWGLLIMAFFSIQYYRRTKSARA